ncbi:MAG TPA: hypothetical protein VN521_00600 [Negativicutes bacterium]|nr:hypothetical protein [Negativicutes bacterium]
MEIVRWFLWPVIIGFIFCLLLNPLIAGPGFIIWLALMYYVYKRSAGTTEP